MSLRTTGLASTVLALAAWAGPLAAQGTLRERDCRCFDREGREIQSCVCMPTPLIKPLPTFPSELAPRARIGVSLEEHPEGVRIREVLAGSPAEEAGLRGGDVITGVGGQSLRQPLADRRQERELDETGDVGLQRLMTLARGWEPGQALDLQVLREGARLTVELEPEATPRGAFGFPKGRDWTRPYGANPLWGLPGGFSDSCLELEGGWGAFGSDCVNGMQLVQLSPELGEYFGVTEGVLVTRVSGSTALGVLPGDVIVAVGGRPVEDVDDVRRILASYDADEEVTLRIVRKRTEIEVSETRR